MTSNEVSRGQLLIVKGKMLQIGALVLALGRTRAALQSRAFTCRPFDKTTRSCELHGLTGYFLTLPEGEG
jgi:hypothetical protein